VIRYSVAQGLFFTFLRRRFPAAFYRAELEEESPERLAASGLDVRVPPHVTGAERQEFVRVEHKKKFHQQIYQLLRTIQGTIQAAQPNPPPTTDCPGQIVVTLLGGWLLPHLYSDAVEFGNLHHFSSHMKLPKGQQTGRLNLTSDAPLQPLSNLTSVRSAERLQKPNWRGEDQEESVITNYVIQSRPTLTRTIYITMIREGRSPWDGTPLRYPLHLTLHRPGGPATLSPLSLTPLRELLHPEDPVLMHAEFLARQSDIALRNLTHILRELELSRFEKPGQDFPEVLILEQERTRRHWFGWGRRSRRRSGCLVLPREQMQRMSEPDEYGSLGLAEKKLLTSLLPALPENLTMSYLYDSDGPEDDGGGGDDAPPSLSPTPSPRETVSV